jgi:hypothetical protein
MLATQEETIDWEGKRDLLVVQLLGLLACRADGLHDDDEKKIDQLLTRRNLVHCEEQVRYLSAEEQVRYLEFWSSHVLAYPDKDPLLAYFSTLYTGVGDGTGDYSSSFEEREAEEEDYETDMDEDPNLEGTQPQEEELSGLKEDLGGSEEQQLEEVEEQASPPASPAASASPPPAASSSVKHAGPVTRAGRPAVTVAAGKAAQAIAREVERLRGRKKFHEADELLAARWAEEGESITPDYATKQAKQLSNQLFANAGGIVAATDVVGKFLRLPEVRVALDFAEKPELELDERFVRNIIDFFANHLATKGTRYAEDQNLHNGLLTAMVDGGMAEENLILAVAKRLGRRWDAVKAAILRRIKLDEEEKEGGEGIWQQHSRSTRCDMYELPGLYAFCHNEEFFRFVSSRSEPLREHVGLREYKVRAAAKPTVWCTRRIAETAAELKPPQR